jgi:glycosyltransferase involved in cell wall biosynthesis
MQPAVQASPIVAHLMTSVSRGGLELYVRELIVNLHAAGVRQVVVCDQHAFMAPELKSLKIPVEFIRSGSRYALGRIATLRVVDKKYGVSIWHSHQRDDMITVALAFFFRKAFRHIFSLYMGFARKKDLLHRLVYRRVEKLVTTSELMNSLARERLPVTPAQIQCIRYGRDDKAFQVKAAQVKAVRKSLGLQPGQKLVLSLCRLDPMKGVREFVDAARLLDSRMRGKFLFVQIGERTIIGYNEEGRPIYLPESEDCYRQLMAAARHGGRGLAGDTDVAVLRAARHGGRGLAGDTDVAAARTERRAKSTSRFKLLPFQKEYQKYLRAADYFVLGSYDEMYSLSVIDAMMAGCLVIGTNNGGTVEQLSHNRGFLIEAKSATAIADALVRAEKNPKEKEKIRKAAQAWVMKEHTWKTVLPQWLKLYGISG